MPCEAENVNIPVPLGLAYRPETHSCDWPDLLTGKNWLQLGLRLKLAHHLYTRLHGSANRCCLGLSQFWHSIGTGVVWVWVKRVFLWKSNLLLEFQMKSPSVLQPHSSDWPDLLTGIGCFMGRSVSLKKRVAICASWSPSMVQSVTNWPLWWSSWDILSQQTLISLKYQLDHGGNNTEHIRTIEGTEHRQNIWGNTHDIIETWRGPQMKHTWNIDEFKHKQNHRWQMNETYLRENYRKEKRNKSGRYLTENSWK